MDDTIDQLLQSLDNISSGRKHLTQFRKIQANAQKVEFVQRLLAQYKIPIPSIDAAATVKCNRKSTLFRASGDKWMARGTTTLFDALVNYNEAICFATADSDELAQAYAQRSAVYFAWNRIDLCLANIELARSCSNCSSDLNALLTRRETRCNEMIGQQTEASSSSDESIFEPKISHPLHAKVPFVADCLDIRENEQYGRYIITHRDLEPGQTLAIEEKYLNVLLPKLRYQRCANCLRECWLNLIPCPGCTATMFCGAKCAQTAQSSYHPFECPLVGFLHEHCDRFHLCAVRATIMALLSFKTIDLLREAVRLADRSAPVTAFTVNHKKKAIQQRYLQVHTFPTKQNERSAEDLIATAVVAAILSARLLDSWSTIAPHPFAATPPVDLLSELLFRHLQIARMYFHSLSSAAKQYRQGDGGGLRGSGAYPFCSLINHACTPNIVRIPFGTKMVVFALRKIRAGEQLFDNYG